MVIKFRWLWLVIVVAWVTFLARPWGSIPALGPLFDLHSGVFKHSEFKWGDRKIAGLKQPVQVAIDKNGIPHLFAQSEEDLFFAQGYILASQRLFQLDLSSRSTSGELSELAGARVLPMDRFYVKLGLRQSILKAVNEYMSNPQTAAMINSYVGGINAYIQTLEDLPIEYKLLGKRPKLFDAARVVHMSKALTFSLNGRSSDYVLSHLQQQISTEKILDLFPEMEPDAYADYVLPGKWGSKERSHEQAAQFNFKTHITKFPEIPQPMAGNGSNNWVVGPSKSMTGHSILANDTHLGLSLPNIWFENQLSCPAFNVYGVSLIDIPGIVNGFTAKTAWGPTNGTTDAMDYYEVEFTSADSIEYKDHDKIETAQVFKESIHFDGGSEDVDVVWTKWGPVLYREGVYGLVANWTGHMVGNELLALRRLYNSTDLKSCMDSFETWRVPIQNFVCADQDHIGLTHAGFIPKRVVGEGRFISPAGESANYLREEVPESARPKRVDPKEGYLRSANERIVDFSYANYMGWEYEEPFRGRRIKQLLEAKSKFYGEDMIAIQNDDYDGQAEIILPTLLKEIQKQDLSNEQRNWLVKLAEWDLHAKADRVEPTIYRSWYYQLKSEIFSDEYSLPERERFFPRDTRVALLLRRVSADPKSSDAEWIDDKKTPEKETLPIIVTQAFKKSWDTLVLTYGKDPNAWTWMKYIHTEIPHVAHIPGFGSKVLSMDGAGESVRGNKGSHGATYKFVIELGDSLKAWMQVPGGPSGDPFSTQYGKDVEEWAAGKMRRVEYYKDWDEAKKRAVQTFELAPGGS